MSVENEAQLQAKLLQETAQIPWSELQSFHQQGNVIVVAPSLDLIKVACQISMDNTQQVSDYLRQELLVKPNDQEVAQWCEADLLLWAVVVSPWVLIQAGFDAKKLEV